MIMMKIVMIVVQTKDDIHCNGGKNDYGEDSSILLKWEEIVNFLQSKGTKTQPS